MKDSFIHFRGILWENLKFEFKRGWETEHIACRSRIGDGAYIVELLNKKDEVLISVSPHVNFGEICYAKSGELRYANVDVYVPLHESATKLIFRKKDLVLFRNPISQEKPKVAVTSVSITKTRFARVRWKVEHSNPKCLTYNLVYVIDKRRGFTIVKDLNKTSCYVSLKNFPGGKNCHLVILATDGFRSDYAVSDELSVPDIHPILWIQSPQDDFLYPADQPISLCGQALDIAGKSLSHKGLSWKVDGKLVSQDSPMATVFGLDPGKHEAELSYVIKGKERIVKGLIITIADRTKEQDEFRRYVANGLFNPESK